MSLLSNDDMRASDQDREDAVAVLCDAYAAGRLNLADIRDRAGAAYSARTWGDLRRLTADLFTSQGVPATRPVSMQGRSGIELRHQRARPALVGDSVSSSGSGLGFVSGRCEVDGAGGVEGFLRGAGREAGAQHGVFVAVAGG